MQGYVWVYKVRDRDNEESSGLGIGITKNQVEKKFGNEMEADSRQGNVGLSRP